MGVAHALEDVDALGHRDRERISRKMRVEDLFGHRLDVGDVPRSIVVDSELVLARGDEHGCFSLCFVDAALCDDISDYIKTFFGKQGKSSGNRAFVRELGVDGEQLIPIVVVELGPIADACVGLERDTVPTAEQLAPSPAGEFGQGREFFQFRHAARPASDEGLLQLLAGFGRNAVVCVLHECNPVALGQFKTRESMLRKAFPGFDLDYTFVGKETIFVPVLSVMIAFVQRRRSSN